MADLALRVSAATLKPYADKLRHMLQHATDFEPFMEEASQYMVRSTQNRIVRSKRQPDGKFFAPLSELTIKLKGSSAPLFESGELARGISVKRMDKRGFTIAAEALNADGENYATFMQRGVKRTSGRWPGKRVPSRRFLGFSEANIKRLSRMLQDYIGIDAPDEIGGDDE